MGAVRILYVDDELDIREVVDISLGLNPDFEARLRPERPLQIRNTFESKRNGDKPVNLFLLDTCIYERILIRNSDKTMPIGSLACSRCSRRGPSAGLEWPRRCPR